MDALVRMVAVGLICFGPVVLVMYFIASRARRRSDPVPVVPVLTLPGWWVDRKAKPNPVHVLNPKEIAKLCTSGPQTQQPNLIRRIRQGNARRAALIRSNGDFRALLNDTL